MTPLSRFRMMRDCLHCEHRSTRMFCNLDTNALKDFDALGSQLEVPAGVTLFEEEAASNHVYVMCMGRVKLSCTSREGKTLILKIAGPGDVLGLGAVISAERYEVTAETIESTDVKSISRAEFMGFLERHGEASMHAAQSMAAEYKSTFVDVRRLALSVSAGARLAGVLLDWGRQSIGFGTTLGQGRAAEMRFLMALTHEELANLIGSSRETVTRMLNRFKREKLIAVRGATMVILAPEKLESLVN